MAKPNGEPFVLVEELSPSDLSMAGVALDVVQTGLKEGALDVACEYQPLPPKLCANNVCHCNHVSLPRTMVVCCELQLASFSGENAACNTDQTSLLIGVR